MTLPAMDKSRFDAVVVGAGPAGIATALALYHVGASLALAGPPPPKKAPARPETRTAALLTSSVDFLKRLNVWEALIPHAAPLTTIRIIDASRSLLRSPDIVFEAAELGMESFGFNITNTALTEVLYGYAAESLPHLLADEIDTVRIDEAYATLTLASGQELQTHLIAGADGRNSVCRKAAQIDVSERRYGQSAIASSFRHSLPHEGVATELHREGGSVTSVPTPEPWTSSLVWVCESSEADELMQMDDEGFAARLQERFDESLGVISDPGPRACFPIAALNANTMGANRTALIGEAGHIMAPIGAQGLNLGLRDAAALADCVADAMDQGQDPGASQAIADYVEARRLDVLSRKIGVDLLGRSLLTTFLPVQIARSAVVTGLNAIGPLKRLLMQAGLAPPASLPRLMRPLESVSA